MARIFGKYTKFSKLFCGKLYRRITARGGKKRGGTPRPWRHFIRFFENSLNIHPEYLINILNCPSFFCGKLHRRITARGGKKRVGTSRPWRHFIRFFENSLNIHRLAVCSKWPEYSVNILNCPSIFTESCVEELPQEQEKNATARHDTPVAKVFFFLEIH
jgi:hypothetical protein